MREGVSTGVGGDVRIVSLYSVVVADRPAEFGYRRISPSEFGNRWR